MKRKHPSDLEMPQTIIKIPRTQTFEDEINDLLITKNCSPKEIIANRDNIVRCLDKEKFKSLSFETARNLFNFFVNDDQDFFEHFIVHEDNLIEETAAFFVSELCEGGTDLDALSPLCLHIVRSQTPEAQEYLKSAEDESDKRNDDGEYPFFENPQIIKEKLIELHKKIQGEPIQIFLENCLFLHGLIKEKHLSSRKRMESIIIYSWYLEKTPYLDEQLIALNQMINDLFLQEDWTWDSLITPANLEKINTFIADSSFIVESGMALRKEQLKSLMQYQPTETIKWILSGFYVAFGSSYESSPEFDLLICFLETSFQTLSPDMVVNSLTQSFPASTLLSSAVFQKYLKDYTVNINEKNIQVFDLDEEELEEEYSDNNCEYKRILTHLAPERAPLNFLNNTSNEEMISLLVNRINELKNVSLPQEPICRMLIQYALVKVSHFNWVVPFLEQHRKLESELISFLPLRRFLKQSVAFANTFEQFPLFKELFDFHKIGIKRNKFFSRNFYKAPPLLQDSIIEYIENAHFNPQKIVDYRARILQVLNKKEFKKLAWNAKCDMMEIFVTNYDANTISESIAQLKQLLKSLNLMFSSWYNPFSNRRRIKNYEHIDLQLLSLVIEKLFPSNILFCKGVSDNFNSEYHPILTLYNNKYYYSESDRNKLLPFFLQLGLFNYLTKKKCKSIFLDGALVDIEKIWGDTKLNIGSHLSSEVIASLIKEKLEEYQSALMPHKSIKKFIIQHGIYKATDLNWLKPLLSKNPELETVLLPFLDIKINKSITVETFIFLLESPAFYELLHPFNAVRNKPQYNAALGTFINEKTKIHNIRKNAVIAPQQKQLLFLILKDLIRYGSGSNLRAIISFLKEFLPRADDEMRNALLNLAHIYNQEALIACISNFERTLVSNLSPENPCSDISSFDCAELSNEMWRKIASYLPKKDMVSLSCSNKLIHGFFSTVRATQEFLHHVTRRNKIKALEMLAKNEDLLFQKERIITVEGRAFYNVSAFQYVLWAADIDMWENMLKWIIRDEEMDNKLYKQILELEQGIYYEFKGKVICETHYNFSYFLAILDKIDANKKNNCIYRLLGKVQKEFPLPLIHFLANHNYKSDEQIDTFYNPEINQEEKWCDSIYLGELFCLKGFNSRPNLGTTTYIPYTLTDERNLRKLKDIFEYKYAKLKLKLGKQECLTERVFEY